MSMFAFIQKDLHKYLKVFFNPKGKKSKKKSKKNPKGKKKILI